MQMRLLGGSTGAPRQVRVLTIDDQPVFLRVATDLVDATAGFVEVGQAQSGAEGLALAAALQPDLVILDVRMTELDGIETMRHLIAAQPALVIVLVSADDVADTSSLVELGAAAVLRKQDLSPQVLQAVWDLHGNRPITGGEGSRP